MDRDQIIALAKLRCAERERLEATEGVRRVLKVAEDTGLLRSSIGTKATPGPIFAEDVMNAGLVEPRVFEVLPALLLKLQGLVEDEDNLPEDLREIVWGHQRPEKFRGMDYRRWIKE